MVPTRPAVLEQEPLRQELERPPGLRIEEGTEPTPEHNKLVLSEHMLVYKPGHTPLGHNTKEILVHMLEHTSRPERHSLA